MARFAKRLFYSAIAIFGAVGGALAADRPVALSDLAAEFRVLRQQHGHFSGGDWNDALDKWGGRKQQVMLALGDALGDGKHATGEIVGLLGAPDETLKPGDMMFAQAYRGADPRVRTLLVYHWRGGHDFLFFASDGSSALASGWWAALE